MKAWTSVLNFFKDLSVFGLTIMIVATAVDVSSRFLFDAPINNLNTVITDLLFPAIIFFSASYMARSGGQVRVSLLFLNMSPSWQTILERLFALIAVAFWFLVMFTAAGRAWQAIVGKFRPTAVFGIPIYVSFGIVVLGSLLAVIEGLVNAVNPGIVEHRSDDNG
jgi:TRAP-type C4-dicarboxylate transport system permease small subunit